VNEDKIKNEGEDEE